MIGDLTIDGKVSFNKNGTVISLGGSGFKLSVVGKYGETGRASATTSDQTLLLGYVGAIGMVGIQNINAPLVGVASAPVIVPMVPGSTTYSYKVVAVQSDGAYSVASVAGTITNGNATLSDVNYNQVNLVAVDDAISYNVYRTAGGPTQGFIGTLFAPTVQLIDNGLGGDGSVAPTTSPGDYEIQFGLVSGTYPIKAKGGDMLVFRWNGATIHYKATFNACDFSYIVIEP